MSIKGVELGAIEPGSVPETGSDEPTSVIRIEDLDWEFIPHTTKDSNVNRTTQPGPLGPDDGDMLG